MQLVKTGKITTYSTAYIVSMLKNVTLHNKKKLSLLSYLFTHKLSTQKITFLFMKLGQSFHLHVQCGAMQLTKLINNFE